MKSKKRHERHLKKVKARKVKAEQKLTPMQRLWAKIRRRQT